MEGFLSTLHHWSFLRLSVWLIPWNPPPHTHTVVYSGLDHKSQVEINFTKWGSSLLLKTPSHFDSLWHIFGCSKFEIHFLKHNIQSGLVQGREKPNQWERREHLFCKILNKNHFTVSLREMAKRGNGSYSKDYNYLSTKQICREADEKWQKNGKKMGKKVQQITLRMQAAFTTGELFSCI